MPPTDPEARLGRDHLVVCGDDALASRVVEELTLRYGEHVTVILPSAKRAYGPRIARLPRVRIIERAQLDNQAFLAADLPSARALALLSQSDLGNFHAALRAEELNADLRLVVSSFNTRLGDRVGSFFPDCAVLSESAMAAPAFVAAALRDPPPPHARVAARTLYLTQRQEVRPGNVVCGVTRDPGGGSPRLSVPGSSSPEVLAVPEGPQLDPLATRRRLRAATRAVRAALWNKTGVAFACFAVILAIGFFLLLRRPYQTPTALYLMVLDGAGAALTSPTDTWSEKVAQILLTLDGMAVNPLVTALILASRLPPQDRASERPVTDHVIVVGLGNVGTRVLGLLHDLSVDVVCVDRNENARGVGLARQLGVRVVHGESQREDTLIAAGIATCQALVSLTSNDTVNLETALVARALASQARIVLRLYDDDLATKIDARIGQTLSRSVSYLAAPEFAAAMLEHQVLRAIPVDRHVLLIAEVPVSEGAELENARAEDVHAGSDSVRLVGLRHLGGPAVDWSPGPNAKLAAGDRLVVVATRAGLGRVRARCQPR